jgi:hypothetical protein
MKQLSDLVVIVPVIAKADCMTMKERERYLRLIESHLLEISDSQGGTPTYDFGEDLNTGSLTQIARMNMNPFRGDTEKSTTEPAPNEISVYNRIGKAMKEQKHETFCSAYGDELAESVYGFEKAVDNEFESQETPIQVCEDDVATPILRVPNIFAIVTDVSGERAYPWVNKLDRNLIHS